MSIVCLWRRADAAEVIGAALRAKAAGAGHRPIATRLDRPASTVRGWLRTFARNPEQARSILVGLLVELDPLHKPGPSRRVGVRRCRHRRRVGVRRCRHRRRAAG